MDQGDSLEIIVSKFKQNLMEISVVNPRTLKKIGI